jgi:hypothetical protein
LWQVVPDLSSSLDDPREHAETLDANHMDMTKFKGPNDLNYKKVGGELKRVVNRMPSPALRQQVWSAPLSAEQQGQIVDREPFR